MSNDRSKCLLVTSIITTLLVILGIAKFFIGDVGVAFAFLVPSLVITIPLTVFNWVAYGVKAPWSALVSAILISVYTLFSIWMITTLPVKIVLIVLEFVSFAKQSKINAGA